MQALNTQQIDAVSGGLMIPIGQARMIGGFFGGMIGTFIEPGYGTVIGSFVGAEAGDFVDQGSIASAGAEESSPLYGLTE